MFQLNKESHLVTVTTAMALAELKNRLFKEGLYFGYAPLDDVSHSISHYLERRIVNLYHFKYGSLPELVSSVACELKEGRAFQLKDAPRAAIGPDFNRMVLGSQSVFGRLKTVVLKVCPVPEKIAQAVILVGSRDEARQIISQLVGQFVYPLYFHHLDLESAAALLNQLKIAAGPTECLVLGLSGLAEMVLVDKKIVGEICHGKNRNIHWLKKKTDRQVLHAHLHRLETYREIREQYRTFLWPASDCGMQNVLETEFTKHVREV